MNLNITKILSRIPVSGCAGSSSSQASSLSNRFGCNLQKCNEVISRGFAILDSGDMHILDVWVRAISHPLGAAILNSGVQWALNLRPAWKHEIMRMVSNFPQHLKNGEPQRPALTHSPSTHPRDSIAIPASLMRGDDCILWAAVDLAWKLSGFSSLCGCISDNFRLL